MRPFVADTTITSANLNTALTILSIGAIIVPVMAGFFIYKLTQIFITRQQFDDYQKLAESERTAIKERLSMVEHRRRNE